MTHSARFVTTPEFSPLTPSPLHRESVTPALLRSETYDEAAGAGGDDPDTLGCGPRPARPAAPLSPRPAARGADRPRHGTGGTRTRHTPAPRDGELRTPPVPSLAGRGTRHDGGTARTPHPPPGGTPRNAPARPAPTITAPALRCPRLRSDAPAPRDGRGRRRARPPRAGRCGQAGRGGTRAGARGRRGRAEERGRLPLPGRRVHKWRTRRGAANGRAPERHSLRESRRGPSRPARRPAGPGGTGSTGSAAPSSSSRLNAPAGRRVSARRKAHNFVPRAPRERKSRAAPAASAAPGPRGAYSGRTAARRSERPAAPHPPSVRPAPGALGKALPTGARLLSFASFSIAGGMQRTKAAPRSDKSGVPGATMKNSEEELQASREHE